MTTTEVATLKRTELQARPAGVWQAGRELDRPRHERRTPRRSGERRCAPSLLPIGTAITLTSRWRFAAAINPLLQAQFDEERVNEMIAFRMTDVIRRS